MTSSTVKPVSNEFPKLRIKAFAPIQERETGEAKYWRQFSSTKEEKLLGAPSFIDFHPITSQYYLVTASTKVTLYNKNDKTQRSYTRFNDDAYSGRFRPTDGKLIVAGDKQGLIKVFDFKTKSLLRDIKGHSAAVRSVTWSSQGLHLISGSDDKKVKVFDLGTEERIWSSKASSHMDYVRSVTAFHRSPNMFLSSSYDHEIKLWDMRQENPVSCMNHGCPVDATMMASSDAMFFSAGGNEIKVWDVLQTGRLIHTFSNHQKNISSLCISSDGSRLFSGGLDGFVKVYSLESLQVIHSMKFSNPVLSVGFSPSDKKLVVGFVDGSLIVKNRVRQDEENDEEKDIIERRQARLYAGAGAAVTRNDSEDGVVETERAVKLKPYERYLKQFSYQAALDAALKSRNPVVVVTVLEELSRRGGLTIALSGRDDASLEPLLSFAAKYITNPRYAQLIVQVTQRLLDLYAPVLGHSDAIDELFMKLYKQVKNEVKFQRQIVKVLGALDGVMSSSSLNAYRYTIEKEQG